MEVTFTKISDRQYISHVVRDDGVEFEVKGYDNPKWLPHDLVHFFVEQALGLKYGFWGCVKAGALFDSMRLIKGQLKYNSQSKSKEILRMAGQHNMEAEVWVGFFSHIIPKQLDQNPQALKVALREIWQTNQPERKAVALEEVNQICKELRALYQEWEFLADGQTLTFKWN